MKTLCMMLLIIGMGSAALASDAHGTAARCPENLSVGCSQKAQQLRVDMRALWEDHVSYTRNVVTSMLGDLPDLQFVTERLLRNQTDIGNAIKPFYGAQAGDKLAGLLKDHILIAAAVVTAAKVGNAADLGAAQTKWQANGKELAAFLSAANPNWKQVELEKMLQMHLDLLTRQVVARLHRDWAADIQAYDEGTAHMMMFADVLTQGLAQQFPDKLGDTK